MSLRRFRPDEGAPRDAGMSLVELAVAMGITAILLAGVGTVFVGGMRGLSQVTSRSELLGSGQTALLTMSERLRAADMTPPQAANPNIVLAGSMSSVTISGFSQNATLAASLAASINAVSAGDPTASYLTATGMVPTRTTFAYQASAAACGNDSGIVQTAIEARFNVSGSQIFAWDSTPVSRCLLRTTVAPTTAAPLFTYFNGCNSATTTATLADIGSIGVNIQAGAAGQNTVRLSNRVCLVNSGGTT